MKPEAKRLVHGIVLGAIVLGLVMGGLAQAQQGEPATAKVSLPLVRSNRLALDAELGAWPMVAANPQRTSWSPEGVSGNLRVEWYRPIEAYIPQNVQVIAANGLLYLATARGLYAIDAASGDVVWRYDTELPLGNSPTVVDGVVYVGGYDRKLHALDALTGAHLWAFAEAQAGFDTNPLVVDGVVFAGNRDGAMYAIGAQGTPDQGRLLWKFQTGGPIHFSAAYGDGVIYFASNDNYAYALRARTSNPNGELVWKSALLPGDGYHSFWPVIYQDKVIFAAALGYRMGQNPGTQSVRDEEGVSYGNYGPMQVDDIFAGLGEGDLVGPTVSGQTWSHGYPVLDASNLTEYLEDNPAPDPHKHKPWRRLYIVLDAATGREYTFDSDHDGSPEYMPVGSWGTNSGNRYPPIVGPDGILYHSNVYQCCSDAKGRIMGWQPTTPDLLSVIGGAGALAEPQAISAGGNIIYRNLCCDRVGDWVDLTTPGRNGQLWSYNLATLAPGYDPMWAIIPGLPRLQGWYKGNTDSINGIYHNHGDQNPIIPYQGRLYVHRSNTLFAFGPGTPQGKLPLLTAQPAQDTAAPLSVEELQHRLEAEVQKIIVAGHLRPGYYNVGQLNQREFADYFDNPGDTLYTLSIAYPHLTLAMQNLLRTYLRQEFESYFDPTLYVSIGWADGAAREAMPLPPEVEASRATRPASTSSGSRFSWQYPPHNFYAMWRYALIVPEDARRIYDLAKTKLQVPVPDLATADYFAQKPYELNAYIAGYRGFLELQALAGMDATDAALRAAVAAELDRLLQLRVAIFDKDTPWVDLANPQNSRYHNKKLDIARNFLWLTPELGDYLRQHILSQVQAALAEYETVAPYWFVARFESTLGEAALSTLYNSPALFQARAFILEQPLSELSKYIDVPAFARGDLFYLQNLVAAIEAADDSPAVNRPPIVEAGSSLNVVAPGVVHINALASDDGLPNPPGSLALSWSVVSGPGAVTFSTPNAPAVTASFDAPGVYVLRLTATDGELASSDDIIIVAEADSPQETPASTNTPVPTPTHTPAPPTHTPTPASGQEIIIDHTSVALFEHIPDQYIAAARALKMLFMDRSVGQNTSESLDCLAVINWWEAPAACRRDYYDSAWHWKTYSQADYNAGLVPARILFDPKNGAFSRANWTFQYFADDWSKMTADFITMLDNGTLPGDYDVYSFQFSYLNVDNATTIANIPGGFFADNPGDKNDVYDLLRRIEQRPDRTFVFWTTSLARSIGTQAATNFNDQMRQFVREHDLVLFDFADIEAHDDRGVPCYDNRDGVQYCTATGECENYPNDGLNLPAICQDYTTEVDGGHLGSVSAGRIRIAKALWVLMARLAGWDGRVNVTPPPSTSTPVPSTATPTRTPTAVPPTATPTRTPTAVPPTATPTRTPTAVPPTATPTRTPTAVPPTATPAPTPTATPTPVSMEVAFALTPALVNVRVGDVFTVAVSVQANAQPLDAAAAFLDFDPAVLQVVTITPGTALSTVIHNRFDNQLGQVDFAAGTLSGPASGGFTLAMITFQARGASPGSPLTFAATPPRRTDATWRGESVLDRVEDGAVAVAAASLSGRVRLQGRPPAPHPRWALPLTVDLRVPGEESPRYLFNVTTSEEGAFTVANIPPGEYDVRVKNGHTLRNILNITLQSGAHDVDLGVLREGDASDDNAIDLIDFSILAASFCRAMGDSLYDARADFNGDDTVDLLDFSLLAMNFGLSGDIPADQGVDQYAVNPSVALEVAPAASVVRVGQTFGVDLVVRAADQAVDGVAMHLAFDPNVLQVVAVTPGTTLETVIEERFDNALGRLDFAAGRLGSAVAGDFVLAHIEFVAVAENAAAKLRLTSEAPRLTEATFRGVSVLDRFIEEATVVVLGPFAADHQLYLPLIAR